MRELLNSIIEKWFVLEPPMFAVACMHELTENVRMDCPVRSGKHRIEYNPDILSGIPRQQLEEILKAEAIRILLKHPYERKPDLCGPRAISAASNVTLSDNYAFQFHTQEKPGDFGLESGHSFEWYCYRIQDLLPEDGNLGGPSRDLCELWEEDDLAADSINEAIVNARNWGTIPLRLAETIIASTKARMDWRSVFSGFRASILSSKRDLTRMRPSRRFGFEQMGSRRRFITRLLVAVDVSGSISVKTLSHFYGVVSSAFKYGFESVDVVQFDCGISKIHSLKKAVAHIEIVGRGGTSFNEPIQYAFEKNYDGLLILTDGDAPEPRLPEGFKTKIMWVCENRESYERHHGWMEKYGRVCTMILP